MWQCHKCSKPVYFAERKQSLGYDWHPECLRCEECGKRLNVGQHEEHKSVPYCHVPCYGALFGPQLFGHGSRVGSHKSFGAKGTTAQRAASQNQMPFSRDYIDLKIKQYNDCFDNKSNKIRGREVNGRMILEGALRVYWGVQSMIHLKEDDDQRTVITVRKRNSCRYSNATDYSSEKSLLNSHSESLKENYDTNETSLDINTSSAVDGGDTTDISMTESISFDTCSVQSLNSASSSKNVSPDHKALTMPIKLNDKQLERDELDELLQVERAADINTKLYQTLPSPSSSTDLSFASNAACGTTSHQHDLSKSDSSEPISNETDFKSAENTLSSSDERTLTNKSTTDDEYLTPNNTLRAMDFDDFGQQMRKEFLENSNLLQSSMDDSLKYKQPIDPSRINDSLRIYGESMMSKSFSGEAAFREVPATVYPYHTLKEHRSDISSNSSNCTRKKSEPSPVTSSADSSVSTENGINRSKSGPNWYRNHSYLDDNDSDESSATLKPTTIKRHTINIKMDCYDELGSNGVESNTSSTATSTIVPTTTTYNDDDDDNDDIDANESVVVLRKPKTGSTAIKRRSGNRRTRTKLKRRCSINGHFYNRETSFFTPPHGSQMSVWASSLVSTEDVVNLLLEKYKVDSQPEHFALFVIRDNGEQRRLRDDEYPLVVRIMLGPHEDVARIFLMDANNTSEISCEVAQFINLSIQECRAILDRYDEEQNREVEKIKDKYADFRQKLVQRMESLKVRL